MDFVSLIQSQFNQQEERIKQCFALLPHQKNFYIDALTYFYATTSLQYWCFQYEKILGSNLNRTWFEALDYAYGRWLEVDQVQQWIGQTLSFDFQMC